MGLGKNDKKSLWGVFKCIYHLPITVTRLKNGLKIAKKTLKLNKTRYPAQGTPLVRTCCLEMGVPKRKKHVSRKNLDFLINI